MKYVFLIAMLTARTSFAATSVCEVSWSNEAHYEVECDGKSAVTLTKNPNRSATLKLLTDQGYEIKAGGEVVILQK